MKPVPKREITGTSSRNLLHFHCATPDAVEWLKTAAPEFGGFHLPAFEGNSFMLAVNPCYDVKEVLKYLLSMGESESE